MDVFSEMKFLFWFGIAIIVPLSFRLTRVVDRNGRSSNLHRLARQVHPITLVCITLALLLPPSWLAALLASAWLIQTGLFALNGLSHWQSRPTFAIEEFCIDAGLIFSPISAIWLIAYCAGFSLLTFDPVLTLLTAVHFTYISLGALVIAGLIGRQLHGSRQWSAYRRIAGLMVAGVPFVAAGITFTRYTGRVWVESLAVLEFAGCLIILIFLAIAGALPKRPAARGLILLSVGCLLATMSLALAYAFGRLTGAWALSIPDMVRWHGWLNAFGFVGCGLLGWTLDTPPSRNSVSKD